MVGHKVSEGRGWVEWVERVGGDGGWGVGGMAGGGWMGRWEMGVDGRVDRQLGNYMMYIIRYTST